jgi:tetratricopeptide (TPR) repeat protein
MASGENLQPDSAGMTDGSKKPVNGKSSGGGTKTSVSVTELELAFAQNPESTAYVDLCLAYIDQGRFMEAMVVCKKGIKAHPDSVDARVLLVKVYAAQKKYKRALQELDELAQQKPNTGEVFLARGKLKTESGDQTGAIDDLKKAIDLDAKLEEATKLLAERGIEYPEKPKVPDPPPVPQGGVMVTQYQGGPQGPFGAQGLPPGAVVVTPMRGRSGVSTFPVGRGPSLSQPPPIPAGDGGSDDLSQAQSEGLPRAVSVVPGMPGSYVVYPPGVVPQFQYGPPRLEGEEELEELAKEHAENKPDKGKPKTSLVLAIAMGVVSIGLIAYRFHEKSRVEAIDRLTTEAVNAFNQDTYGSYKTAAGFFEEIINRHDSSHALTLGRLAHTYAILWGEHGEVDIKPKLDEILARAEKKAPEVSHTVAARGLVLLYDGKDRQANAAKAKEALAPIIQKVKEVDGAPSYADLTLAIAELELGNYESATETLGSVKQVLPGSVRAKVWHARAAYRAGRYGTAEAAFSEALRAKPGHPGARAGLALVKVVRGDLNGAAENILKFDELPQKEISNRDRALAEFARSEVFRAAGEESKATGAYENAIRFDPGNADFPYGLGKSYLDKSNFQSALAPLKKAVGMEKTRVPFLIALGEAEMANDEYPQAKEHIDLAIARAPGNVEAAMAKARYLRRTKSGDAEAYLNKLRKDYPSAEGEIDLELGRYLKAIGKLDEAKASLEKAVDKMGGLPPSKQGEIVLAFGKLCQDRRENDLALSSFRKAAELGNIEASYSLAEMLRYGGKDERAEAKRNCERYLAAGAALQHTSQAKQICDSIR